MTTVAVIGAGLAGLTAAVSAAEAGADEVVVLERAEVPGGTSVLSSGWIWRYQDLPTFAWGAPHGDRALQRVLWGGLQDALVWLERQGSRRVANTTGSPRTEGVRIDPAQTVEALTRRLPKDALRCGSELVEAVSGEGESIVLRYRATAMGAEGPVRELTADAVVFAGGGYAADLERLADELGVGRAVQERWARRNAGLSDGSSMDAAVSLGALRVPVTGEFYGRAMPVGVRLWPDDYVRFSQVYGEHAWVVDGAGNPLERAEHDWSDAGLVRDLARRTGQGWYLLDRPALQLRTPYGTVERAVAEAATAGALVLEAVPGNMADTLAEHGTELQTAALERSQQAICAVGVRPGITHTLGGLRVDTGARVVIGERRLGRVRVHPRVYAAGVEVGGVAAGGYASGLAQALVLGRIAGMAAASTPR